MESGALSVMRRASACTAVERSPRHHWCTSADLVGAPRLDRLAGEQAVAWAGPIPPLDRAEGDHDSMRQGHAERGLGGHAQVAVGQLVAARDRVAVERGDRGT
jgi:hypothetical protein